MADRLIVVDCIVTEFEDGHQVNKVTYRSDIPQREMHDVCGDILSALHSTRSARYDALEGETQ